MDKDLDLTTPEGRAAYLASLDDHTLASLLAYMADLAARGTEIAPWAIPSIEAEVKRRAEAYTS